MKNKEELKKFILNAFKEGNLSFAFEQLLSLPHHEVATLLSKNKWLQDSIIAKYFWDDFCLNQYELVFDGPSKETIFNWYLSDLKSTNEELNQLLVERHPSVFIKAIKRNRSFLDKEFLDRIIQYQWNDENPVDVDACLQLQKTHTSLQNNIDRAWSSVMEQKTETILSSLIHWIDVQFYQDYSDLNHQKLLWIYNYAVSFLFSKKELDTPVSEETFDEMFFKTINSTDKNFLGVFLVSISEWIQFETTFLSSYCFDDNYQATMIDSKLDFDFKSNETYEDWKKDNERYLVNAKRYFVFALQIYDYQDEIGELNIPSGNSEISENINHGLYIKNEQSTLFLGDLSIRNLIFHFRDVHFSKVLSGLMSYSMNRQWRYVEQMKELSSSGHDWNHSLHLTMQAAQQEGVDNIPVPYIYETIENFTALYKHAIPELSEVELNYLISHFSYRLLPCQGFDPFNLRFSVLETPFLRLGDYLFTSTSLFASNDWFYSFGQRAMKLYANKSHDKERNETASEMESSLGEEFEKHSWKVKVISQHEANQIDGDIDIFVNDGETQLLIQLKRTKFKLDLASNYKDSLDTDLKAAGQLNEAVKSLDICPMPGMEILHNHQKWIVTTSFEGILSEVDSCLKVNYFDLLWALRNRGYNSLDELIKYIVSDGPFKDCRHYLDILD